MRTAQLGTLLALCNRFKTTTCSAFTEQAGWACIFGESCVYQHSKNDSRRDPLTHIYGIEPCPHGGFNGARAM